MLDWIRKILKNKKNTKDLTLLRVSKVLCFKTVF